jgi:hypothetical protein
MKTIFLFAITLCSLGFAGGSLFRAELSPSLSQAEEVKNFNHLKNEKVIKALRIKQQRLISIDANALSSGRIEAELFDGAKETFDLTMKTNGKDSVWKGTLEKNRGNFKLSKTDGIYRGYIFVSGRYFIISSISKGKAVLYEQDLSYKCGVGDKERQNDHSN